MGMLAGLSEAIPRTTEVVAFKYLSLLSMATNPMTVRDWFFGRRGVTPVAQLGLPLWAAGAALVAFVALTAFLAHRRYRKEL